MDNLDGDVETYGSYISGRLVNTAGCGRDAQTKAIVLGIKHRAGNMVAIVIPELKSATIQPKIEHYVAHDTIVHTNEWLAYRLLRQGGFAHRTVHSGAGQWEHEATYTYAIEHLWPRLKPSIRGTPIHV